MTSCALMTSLAMNCCDMQCKKLVNKNLSIYVTSECVISRGV